MQIDALAVRLRPRAPLEAADLGVRLCQHAARDVYRCYAIVAAPIVVVALAFHEVSDWLPSVIIWWSKPWMDRTILFVLSRAAFGQTTSPGDVWRAQRDVWWRQILRTLTLRRLSPWRSLTGPVYQLEGLAWRDLPARIRQIRRRTLGAALLMTGAFWFAETALSFSAISLLFWLAPPGTELEIADLFSGTAPAYFRIVGTVGYALAVLFIEPFYVAAGFAMYLNRRSELEAWDIEQEFRRAFAA